MMRTPLSVATGLALAAFAAGCGQPSLSPCGVSGKVLVNDRPAEGVYVAIHPVGGAPGQGVGSGRTDKGGAFSLTVGQPGEYTITAFWPKVTVEGVETVEGEDAFKGRFRDPQRPVTKATIRAGDNPLPPIALKFP